MPPRSGPLTLAAIEAGEELPQLLPVIDFKSWHGFPPARESAWGTWLPLRQTTMLTGRGGIGKSLLEQTLLTCIAMGRPFLGMETRQSNTLYVTCEDDTDELWRRQAAICTALNIPLTALSGKLHLASLCGEANTALGTFDENGKIQPTDRWKGLEATVEALDIGVFAFDNATDAMAGDLNDIHQVAEFVNMLTGLAIRCNGVAMILHHPNKAGEDWLGSVAWHNKVRSRLIIQDGEDGDPDSRIILNPKANYGPQGGKIAFRWWQGAFVHEEEVPADLRAEMSEAAAIAGDNGIFLDCLDAKTRDRLIVSPNRSPNYAPTQFEPMPAAKGIGRERLLRAMERLRSLGEIEYYDHQNANKGRTIKAIRRTSRTTPDGLPDGLPDGSRTVPGLAPDIPRTTPHRHPPP